MIGAGERIQRFNSNMQFVSQITTGGNTVLDHPEGIATDEQGHLYVADTGNSRVQQFQYSYWLSLSNDGSQAGTVGTAYSSSVTVQDAQGPLSFTVTAGQLPPGLSLNTTTGEISGTPTLAGDYWLTIDITDGQTTVQATPFIVISNPPPAPLAFTSSTLPNARVGVPYSRAIGLNNVVGTAHYENITGVIRYDQQGNMLGMASGGEMGFNTTTGLLSGTPISTAGSYRFTLEAYDDRWQVVSQQFTLNVDPAHQVTTLLATNLTDNYGSASVTLNGATNYPDEITARGFQYGLDTNYGTQVADNTVNPGYKVAGSSATVASSDLQLSGGNGMTSDASGNRYLVDTSNNRVLKYSKSGALQATWGSAGSGDGEFARPKDIAIGPSGKFYVVDDDNNRVQVLNQYGGYEGQFPLLSDMNMAIAVDSSENVYVSGQEASGPWYARDYRPYVRKYSASGTLLLDWGSQGSANGQFGSYPYDLAIDSNDDIYVVDITYNSVQKFDDAGQFILKIGGTGPEYNGGGWTDGEFINPRAIAKGASNDLYVVDNGRIQVFNSNGGFGVSWNYDQSDSSIYAPYSLVADSEGNVITASWDLSGGWASPQLITYSSAIQADLSGLSCGTTYHYRAFATNADGTKYGNDAIFTTPSCPDDPIKITTLSLQDGAQGSYYQDLVNVEFATGNVSYSVASGALPDGLSLDPSTGYITGTPMYGGNYSFSVLAADSNSSDTQSLSISVSTLPPPPLRIITTTLPDATIWYDSNYDYYDQYIYTEDYYNGVNFTLESGSLPPGLELSNASWYYGRISGYPTTPGTYTFTLKADDSRWQGNGVDTQEYTIVVPEPTYANIYIDTTTLGHAMDGFPYDATIYYQNARTTPVFSLVSGALPDGISLTLNGYLQGTPTTPGTYTFTVQVDDGFSTDTQELTLVVDPAPPPIVNTPFVSITSPSTGASFAGGVSTITGTGPANQTITLFVDNQQVGTTTASSEGLWTYSATGIAAGNHTFDAKWIPGAEVMFVPYLDMQNYRTNVRVYDTSTDQLIKEVSLPFYSFAIQAIVSPNKDKLFLVGVFEANGEGGVWEVDLNSAAITAYHSGGAPIMSAVMSPDGTKMYTNSFTNVMQTFTVGRGFGDGSLTLSGGGFDAPAMLKMTGDGSELYALVFDSNAHTPVPFTIKTISTVDLTVQQSIDVTSVVNPDVPEWASGFGVDGTTAYVAHTARSPNDHTGTSTLRLYNLSNGTLLKTINISEITAQAGYAAAGSIYIDSVNQVAYSGGKDIAGSPGYSYLLRVDLQSDTVQATQLTSGQGGGGLLFLRGLAAAPSLNKLYLSPWLNGQPTEGVEVYNMGTQSVLSDVGHPILNPANSYAYAFGSSFIASITPPKATIAFSVPPAPVDCHTTNTCPQPCEATNTCPKPCEQLGTCPKPCEETNTCPPKPCEVTNTCPPQPCEVTKTCPVVQPPATTITPRIISTQFPSLSAAPSTSRLGWFDRGVLAVAHFVPAQAALGFPFILFVLLLLFALSLYYQSSNEVRKDKLNKTFLAKRISVRAQQDSFIALASHYLNTPITIIQGGVEMVEDEGKGK